MDYRSASVLDTGTDLIRQSPTSRGTVELIVRRPEVDEREVMTEVELNPDVGVVGDNWLAKRSTHTPEGAGSRDKQVTIMNARVIALIAGGQEAWPPAGDQLYADLDLSLDNLPAGTRLEVGTAVVEVSDSPHTGCAKFRHRFGEDALRFVNSPEGKAGRFRGVNTRVVQAGIVRQGDFITKLG